MILSPDKMYVFFWPYHNASPYVTGIKPDFAIFSISLIFLIMGLFPDIKSVGGRQYGFSLFFSIESKIILFNSIIEFLTMATPLRSYFFSFVCISYFTDQ